MTTVTDVLCPCCGCLCDDIVVEVQDNKVVDVKHACAIGASKLMGHNRIESPMIRKNGVLVDVTMEEAVNEAAQILVNSKRPLMYGWACAVCEAMKKGILWAEETGAVIDTTATVCHGSSAIGVEEKGLPGATLGQSKNRADVVIFWGCNPIQAHPRHEGRYSVFPRGFFTPKGRKGRKVITIDVRETDTAKLSDEFIKIDPGCDYLVLSAMRSVAAGHEAIVPDTVGGVSKEQIMRVVNICKEGRFGILFFGMGVTQTRGRYKNIDNAISLVTEMNSFTKFTTTPMRGHYNITGVGQVLAWESGFPMAVDYGRGAPFYSPGETSANDVLLREDVDAAVIIAGDAGAHFPGQSLRHLARIPVIQIDPYANPTTEFADVVIPVGVSGIEVEGTAYRMDAVSLRMRKFLTTDHISDEEVIDLIRARTKEIKAEGKGIKGTKGE